MHFSKNQFEIQIVAMFTCAKFFDRIEVYR